MCTEQSYMVDSSHKPNKIVPQSPGKYELQTSTVRPLGSRPTVSHISSWILPEVCQVSPTHAHRMFPTRR